MMHPFLVKVATTMPRVWSNGWDVVVAVDLNDLPRSLDNYYRVTGHTLRPSTWQELPDGTLLQVESAERGCVPVMAGELRRVVSEGWVGRIVAP
jgi:hypothetical protein